MPEFDPDAPVKSDVLNSLSARHAQIKWALANNPVKGFVLWNYCPEERSILKAFYVALAMVRTDCSNEWLVVGSGVFALLRSLDEFKLLDAPQIACGLTYAGDIHHIRVYLLPTAPALEFSAGNNDTFGRGVCTNFPWLFGDETPPPMPVTLVPNPGAADDASGGSGSGASDYYPNPGPPNLPPPNYQNIVVDSNGQQWMYYGGAWN